MDPLPRIIGSVIAAAIILLACIIARRKARQRIAALEQTKADGAPIIGDVGAYMALPGRRKNVNRFRYGTIHIQSETVTWQSRSNRRPMTEDLTGASIVSRQARQDLTQNLFSNYQITLRRADKTWDLMVRRPLVRLIETGLQQTAGSS